MRRKPAWLAAALVLVAGVAPAGTAVGPICTSLPAPGGQVVHIDAPGVLDRPGTTYVLTEDVTAEQTAFMVTADGVTLDLGGHTVTYGTAKGVDRCSGVFLRPPGGESAFAGVPREGFGGGSRFALRNGWIEQGPGGGKSCFAVYVRGCRGLEIARIASEVHSRDSDSFHLRGCSDVNVHHNHFVSKVRRVTNRHWPGTGVITVLALAGPLDVHHNVIDGGGQWGIRVSGSGGHLARVHHNVIRHRSYVTNGYAVGAHARNMEIFANVIKPVAGRGVHLTGSAIDFHNNIVDVRERPNPEYPRTRAHGVKLEGCTRTLVHHNSIRAVAEKGYGDADPLDFDCPKYAGNRVFKNTVTALRKTADLWAASVNLLRADPDCLTVLHDNVFRTNHQHVRVDWLGAAGVRFLNNRFERLDDAEEYRFVHFSQSLTARSRGLLFRDSVLAGGADFRKHSPLHPRLRRPGIDLRFEQTARVRVADPAGRPIGGAVVAVRQHDTQVASEITDSAGEAPIPLLAGRIVGDPAKPFEAPGPCELVVTWGDLPAQRFQVDPARPDELSVTFADPARRLYLRAGPDQRRKIGEAATLDAKVVVTGEAPPAPDVTWRQLPPRPKLALTDLGGGKARVEMRQGEYLFEVTARLGEEVVKDRTKVRADAKLTPTAVAAAPKTAKLLSIVQLDGTASRDPRGFPPAAVRYRWRQVAGPAATLSSEELPAPIFYPAKAGTYTFELTVSNPIRTSAPVRCSVTVGDGSSAAAALPNRTAGAAP